jgi:hypothetical protein
MNSMQSISLHRADLARVPTRRKLAALFLVGTVLLCQGLFCALHQVSGIEIPVVEYSSSAIEPGHSGEHSGGHFGMLECTAAILVVFLAAVMRLFHKGVRIGSRFAASLLSNKYWPLSIFHLPRGPTVASQLQVFRL